MTGETFFHHGIDFSVNHYLLSAVATGTVSAIGSDAEHGIYQTIRYGKYEVTYRHLSNVFANFSQSVKAGQTIAISGDLLHMEVRFDGEEINPLEFLTMLYGNIKALEHNSQMGINELDMNIPSPYDTDRQEIEALMLRFLPSYFEDLQQGAYSLPEHTEQSLRNIFSLGASKHYSTRPCRAWLIPWASATAVCLWRLRCRTCSLPTFSTILPCDIRYISPRWTRC